MASGTPRGGDVSVATKPLSTAEIADASGLSYRQLDHWRRVGAIHPSIRDADGSGSRIAWSAHDGEVMVAIGRVYRDLMETLGTDQLSTRFIRRLWRELHMFGQVQIHHGSVRIEVEL